MCGMIIINTCNLKYNQIQSVASLSLWVVSWFYLIDSVYCSLRATERSRCKITNMQTDTAATS